MALILTEISNLTILCVSIKLKHQEGKKLISSASLDFSNGFLLFKILSQFHLHFLKLVNIFIILFISLSLLLILAFTVDLLRIRISDMLVFIFDTKTFIFLIFLSIVKDGSNRTFLVPVLIHIDFQKSNLVLLFAFVIRIVLFAVCELNTWYFLTIDDFYQSNNCHDDAQTDWPDNSICEHKACRLSDRVFLQVKHNWYSNHSDEGQLANDSNDGLEIKGPHAIRNLVND